MYLYTKGFLHSKLMVSDDALSTVGSTNIDFRSFEHNFEVNAFAYDTETALLMREVFLADQRYCEQLSPKAWQKRLVSENGGEHCAADGAAAVNNVGNIGCLSCGCCLCLPCLCLMTMGGKIFYPPRFVVAGFAVRIVL